MTINWIYACLYFIGVFLLARGVQQQDMPPIAYIAFGVGIICGLACIQLSEKK